MNSDEGGPMYMDLKKQEMFEKMSERKKEVKVVRKIVAIITVVLLFIVGIIAFAGYNYVKGALKPIDPKSDEIITVEIPIGSGITLISKTLESADIIKDAKIFKYYAKFKNESQFQAGSYDLTQAMTMDEIIESLKNGVVYREPIFSITVPEGLTLEQIAEIIAKKTDYTAEEFTALVTSDAFVKEMMAMYPNLITEEVLAANVRNALEGYLYPATYPFYDKNPSLKEIVVTMIGEMDKLVLGYKEAIIEQEMTVHEFLTFASLLEEEATAQTDRETIASVFYNRLETGMPLQTDPTVLYALGSHKDQVLYKDLEIENPYNTYQNQGLPPGPIAGPGKISLDATLSPTDTEYLYFLADTEGNNHFSKTYDEHLVKVEKYLR